MILCLWQLIRKNFLPQMHDFCTSELKMKPMIDYVLSLKKLHYHTRAIREPEKVQHPQRSLSDLGIIRVLVHSILKMKL